MALNNDSDNVQKRGAPDDVPATPLPPTGIPGVENNARRFRSKWDLLSDGERTRLKMIPFNGVCTGCGTPLETEADFAQHFHIPDERYINLGYCPHTERGRELMESSARVE